MEIFYKSIPEEDYKTSIYFNNEILFAKKTTLNSLDVGTKEITKKFTLEYEISDLYKLNSKLIVQTGNIFYVYYNFILVDEFSFKDVPVSVKNFDKLYFLLENGDFFSYKDCLTKLEISLFSKVSISQIYSNFYIKGNEIYFLTKNGLIFRSFVDRIILKSPLIMTPEPENFINIEATDIIINKNRLFLSYETGVEVYKITSKLTLDYYYLENSYIKIFKSGEKIFLKGKKVVNLTEEPEILLENFVYKIFDDYLISKNKLYYIVSDISVKSTKENKKNVYKQKEKSAYEKVCDLFYPILNISTDNIELFEKEYKSELIKILEELNSLKESFPEKIDYLKALKEKVDEEKNILNKKREDFNKKKIEIELRKQYYENLKLSKDFGEKDLASYEDDLNKLIKKTRKQNEEIKKIKEKLSHSDAI